MTSSSLPPSAVDHFDYDAIIVGGSAAGLSAALVLGRARRRVLVADGGAPRNLPASAVHAFLSRDGTAPMELRRLGRDQLQRYGVVLLDQQATDVSKLADGFVVRLADGARLTSRKLLLASGVIDELPAIDGLAALWGTGVLHCPYCHGWELRDQPLAVLGQGKAALELVALLYGWSRDLVLCSNGAADLGDEDRGYLRRLGVRVVETPITRLDGEAGRLHRIVLEGGDILERRALFLRPHQRQRSSLGARLGCALGGNGLIRTNRWGHTTVPGVFAAGDAANAVQKAIVAAGDAAVAATMLDAELIREDHERWRHGQDTPTLPGGLLAERRRPVDISERR